MNDEMRENLGRLAVSLVIASRTETTYNLYLGDNLILETTYNLYLEQIC